LDPILLLKALILGIVEGLTEFLPISSTGHLILAGDLLDFNDDRGKLFEIVIQTGAILAVCWEYRADIAAVLTGLGRDRLANRLTLNLAIAFMPLAILGLAFKKAIEAHAKANGLRTTRWKIFECSGSGAGQTNAYSLINHGATLAVVGFTMDKVEVRLSNLMAFHARALGNWGCLPEYYPAALDLVLDGRINLANFVERHPLAQINEVFEAAHAHKLSRRAILTP